MLASGIWLFFAQLETLSKALLVISQHPIPAVPSFGEFGVTNCIVWLIIAVQSRARIIIAGRYDLFSEGRGGS